MGLYQTHCLEAFLRWGVCRESPHEIAPQIHIFLNNNRKPFHTTRFEHGHSQAWRGLVSSLTYNVLQESPLHMGLSGAGIGLLKHVHVLKAFTRDNWAFQVPLALASIWSLCVIILPSPILSKNNPILTHSPLGLPVQVPTMCLWLFSLPGLSAYFYTVENVFQWLLFYFVNGILLMCVITVSLPLPVHQALF